MRGSLIPVVAVVLVAGCGAVKDEHRDAQMQPGMFSVRGTVTGFAGRGMVLQLNGGNDLPITADGSFVFPTQLADGATFAVTVKSSPVCPQRLCVLSSGTGMIAGADAMGVTVTCNVPHYRMISQNWGELSVRITDDLGAIANNATATPRIIVGAATTLSNSRLDSVAYDTQRDTIYAASHATAKVAVFASAATATGNIAPTRTITITGETALQGVEIDAARDRLYLSSATKLYVITGASTANGAVVPPVAITLASPAAISLDPFNDRLFVGGDFTSQLFIFNGASGLTSSSVPDRTVTWAMWSGPPAVAIDACRDRLYLGSNNTSPAGFTMFAFDNASMLTGTIVPDSASQARLNVGPVLNAAIDSSGVLWYWPDSATSVKAINAPAALAGAVTPTADKTINGVVNSGYGLDLGAY
jgi:6-phosphogluconolactonase